MDSTSSQSTTSKVKGERRNWTDEENEAILSLLEEAVANNMRQDAGQFKQGTLIWIEEQLALKFPNAHIKVKPHIESKMRKLKSEYSIVYDMVNTSGFGWDDVNKKILVENEDVWAAYVKKDSNLKGYRKKTFPHYDRLVVIFGKDRANGNGSEAPADVEEDLDRTEYSNTNNINTEVEEPIMLSDDDIQEHNNSTSIKEKNRRVRKRTKETDSVASTIKEFGKNMFEVLKDNAKIFGAMAENSKVMRDFHNDSRAIAEELTKMEGLDDRERIKAGRVLMQNPNQIHLFWGFQGDLRVKFVKDLLEDI